MLNEIIDTIIQNANKQIFIRQQYILSESAIKYSIKSTGIRYNKKYLDDILVALKMHFNVSCNVLNQIVLTSK
jgi:hypothetical protein